MSESNIGPRIYGAVKVGDSGEIVILADAMKELNINPGDRLIVMAGVNRRGLAIIKANTMCEVADQL